MPTVQFRKSHNYFISSEGFIFKIENGSEKRIPSFKNRSKRLLVKVDGKQYDLLYLMMEHFKVKYTQSDKIKFTVTKEMTIPLSSIIVKPFLDKFGLAEEEEKLLFKFKCDVKANSANYRSDEMITPVQVFFTLKIHDFKCVYCSRPLEPEIWHLDHFVSLSNKGRNIFENVVPSCSTCNIMKGAMDGNQFYARCRKIAERCVFAGKDLLVEPLKPEMVSDELFTS